MAIHTRRSLWQWLEVALWPGVSSNHGRDGLHLLARVEDEPDVADGGLSVILVTVTAHDEDSDPAQVIRGAGLTPLVDGTGHVSLGCSRCGFAICRGIGSPTHFLGLLLECPRCVAWQRVVLVDLASEGQD